MISIINNVFRLIIIFFFLNVFFLSCDKRNTNNSVSYFCPENSTDAYQIKALPKHKNYLKSNSTTLKDYNSIYNNIENIAVYPKLLNNSWNNFQFRLSNFPYWKIKQAEIREHLSGSISYKLLMKISDNYIINLDNFVLFGTETGLWISTDSNPAILLKSFSNVIRIEPHPQGYFVVCERSIYFTPDLIHWEKKNNGLKESYLKTFDGESTGLTTNIQIINDFEYDPINPSNLIVSSINGVCVSTNMGDEWHFYSTPSWSAGVKSVGIYTLNNKIYIMMGHPYEGFYVSHFRSEISWKKNSSGLFVYESIYEEISDLLIHTNDDGLKLFAANNFHQNIDEYHFEWNQWRDSYQPDTNFGLIECMTVTASNYFFVTFNYIMRWQPGTSDMTEKDLYLTGLAQYLSSNTTANLECIAIISNNQPILSFHDLWLLNYSKSYLDQLPHANRKGIYISADHLTNMDNSPKLDKALSLISNTELNMLVVDMKDDNGYIRFQPENEYVSSFSNWNNVVDVKRFLSLCESNDIYTCARIVLFKDKQMYYYNEQQYAIKDLYTGFPWRGYWVSDKFKVSYASGYWVDIYCEDIWKYNVAIARELEELGFDEVQFDYIRLATDGANLLSQDFTWNEYDLDYTSGLISFLKYARDNISIPISVDIYGANSWHRISGTTQQNIEQMSDYVDVICPMFYPSHFSDTFLDGYPYENRPYRIYYYGSLRSLSFTRGQLVIRPWAQAFKLDVDYDLTYYGIDYISNQVKGILDSTDCGYTFWNPKGNYSILNQTFKLNNS